jgi:hypothetical protein
MTLVTHLLLKGPDRRLDFIEALPMRDLGTNDPRRCNSPATRPDVAVAILARLRMPFQPMAFVMPVGPALDQQNPLRGPPHRRPGADGSNSLDDRKLFERHVDRVVLKSNAIALH